MFNVCARLVLERASQAGWLQRHELSSEMFYRIRPVLFVSFTTFLLEFLWLHCCRTPSSLTHSQRRSLHPRAWVKLFFSLFFPVLFVDLRDSIVNFTAQRVSVCIRHFVLAVYPNAVLVLSQLQNDWSQSRPAYLHCVFVVSKWCFISLVLDVFNRVTALLENMSYCCVN